MKTFLLGLDTISSISIEENYKFILNLNQDSKQFSDLLNGGELKIGVCQKIINLYLKYLWCLDLIPKPPIMPLDGRVLAQFKNCNFQNWTEISDIETYKSIIESIHNQLIEKGIALSLPDWELNFWNNS